MPSGALRRLFLLAEFVAALTRRGLGKRFTLDRGDDNKKKKKKHVGQAAAKRGDQCPEQEFADLHPGLFQFLSHKQSSFICFVIRLSKAHADCNTRMRQGQFRLLRGQSEQPVFRRGEDPSSDNPGMSPKRST